MRIVSLVPSLTEFLCDIGLEKSLVGRTRFCIHPKAKVSIIPKIGGTKNPTIPKIRALKPDWVIANKEENRKEDVEAIQEFTQVIVTKIDTIEDAFREMNRIGTLLGLNDKVNQLIGSIKLRLPTTDFNPIKTAYFIWKDPWMSVGCDTYIHDVMRCFGLENVCSNHKRYPSFAEETLRDLQPELVLLSSEPFPFSDKHIKEAQQIWPQARIECISGEWFSWYGSGMLNAFKALGNWRNNMH
jgi:ABC-type Fe3+-hydroxamate transport system substrate-binding protein